MRYTAFVLLFSLLQTDVNGQQTKYDLNDPTLITQSYGYQLTLGDINASIEYMEFILAQDLNRKYKQAAQNSLKEQFKMNPASLMNEVQQVKQLLPSIIQMTDITQIANYRNNVITTLHLNFLNQPNRPILLQLIDVFNPVFVYDAIANICLTKRDIEAIIELGQFGNELAGLERQTVTENDRQQVTQAMEAQIYKMSIEEKQQLLILADYIPLMKQTYANMPATQQTAFKQSVLQSMAAAQTETQNGNNCQGCSDRMKVLNAKQANGTLTQQDLAEMQREMQAQQNMFTTMNNMNLESHATMLNVINNLGNGDTYYKVEYNNW